LVNGFSHAHIRYPPFAAIQVEVDFIFHSVREQLNHRQGHSDAKPTADANVAVAGVHHPRHYRVFHIWQAAERSRACWPKKNIRKKEKEPREKSPQLPNAAVAFASIE